MQRIQDRYEFDPGKDELGKGGFGRVFKAQDLLLKREVVLKFAESNNLPERYSLIQEIRRVIDFNHPNLVRYYDAIVLDSQNSFGEAVTYQIGVMEYIRGGDLKQSLKKQASLPLEKAKQITRGILAGLSYLHEHGIIHRDIKPANILLSEKKGQVIPKICDFGISKMVGTEATLSNLIGTFEYMSPEQLGEDPNQKIRANSDCWSLGVLLYEMLTGRLPFGSRRTGSSDAKILANIISGPIPNDIAQLPAPFDKIVGACLVRDAKARAQTADALSKLLDEKEKVPIQSGPTKKTPATPKPEPPKTVQVSHKQPSSVSRPVLPASTRSASPSVAISKPYQVMIIGGSLLLLALLIWGGIRLMGSSNQSGLRPFQDAVSRLYGYEDASGATVIRARYVEAEEFEEGLASVTLVRNDGSHHSFYIDETGDCVVNCPEIVISPENLPPDSLTSQAEAAQAQPQSVARSREADVSNPEGGRDTDANEAERGLWKNVSARNTLTAYQLYLKRYPNGQYAAEAKKRSQTLRLAADKEKQPAFKIPEPIPSKPSPEEASLNPVEKEKEPEINAFIFVEQEPYAINMEEIQKLIGYPQTMRDAGIQGQVIVRVLVGKKGEYIRHRMINQVHPILSNAVEKHIQKLRFKPAIQGGKPIMFWINIPFNFKLLK